MAFVAHVFSYLRRALFLRLSFQVKYTESDVKRSYSAKIFRPLTPKHLPPCKVWHCAEPVACYRQNTRHHAYGYIHSKQNKKQFSQLWQFGLTVCETNVISDECSNDDQSQWNTHGIGEKRMLGGKSLAARACSSRKTCSGSDRRVGGLKI